MTTWREKFRPTIERVLQENQHLDEPELRKLLIESRPDYCHESNYPMKIWRDEINHQLGKKKLGKPGRKKTFHQSAKGQKSLFES